MKQNNFYQSGKQQAFIAKVSGDTSIHSNIIFFFLFSFLLRYIFPSVIQNNFSPNIVTSSLHLHLLLYFPIYRIFSVFFAFFFTVFFFLQCVAGLFSFPSQPPESTRITYRQILQSSTNTTNFDNECFVSLYSGASVPFSKQKLIQKGILRSINIFILYSIVGVSISNHQKKKKSKKNNTAKEHVRNS